MEDVKRKSKDITFYGGNTEESNAFGEETNDELAEGWMRRADDWLHQIGAITNLTYNNLILYAHAASPNVKNVNLILSKKDKIVEYCLYVDLCSLFLPWRRKKMIEHLSSMTEEMLGKEWDYAAVFRHSSYYKKDSNGQEEKKESTD